MFRVSDSFLLFDKNKSYIIKYSNARHVEDNSHLLTFQVNKKISRKKKIRLIFF